MKHYTILLTKQELELMLPIGSTECVFCLLSSEGNILYVLINNTEIPTRNTATWVKLINFIFVNNNDNVEKRIALLKLLNDSFYISNFKTEAIKTKVNVTINFYPPHGLNELNLHYSYFT